MIVIHGGTSDGWDVVSVECDACKVTLTRRVEGDGEWNTPVLSLEEADTVARNHRSVCKEGAQ